MKDKIDGYITLDYELGMGNYPGTPEKCLITPMNHLTAMLEKYSAKMNIFVDAAYLLKLKELKDLYPQLQNDFDIITKHITKLDAEGHAIQLHLHPQWCYYSFDGNAWIPDYNYYKLCDMPLDKQKQLIRDGITLLNSLVSKKVSAFRAGGYSIENFSQLYDTFLSVGITIDTSGYRGNIVTGKYNTYDYRYLPMDTSWKFLKNHKKKDENGNMTEYPISTIVVPTWEYLLNKRAKHPEFANISETKRIWGDGTSLNAYDNKLEKWISKFKMLWGKKAIRASIEQSEDLEKVYAYSSTHYRGDDFVIIGHPKAISPYNIRVLEHFIKSHPEIEFKLFE